MNTHDSDLEKAFLRLEEAYGDHTSAAAQVGINRDHYRKLRNGRASVPARTRTAILNAARLAEVPPQPQDTPGDGPGVPQDELSARGASLFLSRTGKIDSGASRASSTTAAA